MTTIGKIWAGQLYGTNTGRLYLHFNITEVDSLKGVLRLSDDQFGLVTYSVNGKLDGDVLSLTGDALDPPQQLQFGTVIATARLQPSGSFSGEWKSSIGTAGTFELFPHLGANQSALVDAGPGQLYTTVRDLGALRLYRDDVMFLVAALHRKFPDSKVVVTHLDRGAQIARFSEDLESGLAQLDELRWLKISAQTPVGSLSRSITIDLGEAFNRVTTQGPDESWVLGEAEATASYLRRRQRRLSTAIGRYRVSFNQIILVVALVALPDLLLPQRAIFASVVLGLVFLANKLQGSLIPNFIADFSLARANWSNQVWPSILSWIISVAAGVAASLVYAILQGWMGSEAP